MTEPCERGKHKPDWSTYSHVTHHLAYRDEAGKKQPTRLGRKRTEMPQDYHRAKCRVCGCGFRWHMTPRDGGPDA